MEIGWGLDRTASVNKPKGKVKVKGSTRGIKMANGDSPSCEEDARVVKFMWAGNENLVSAAFGKKRRRKDRREQTRERAHVETEAEDELCGAVRAVRAGDQYLIWR